MIDKLIKIFLIIISYYSNQILVIRHINHHSKYVDQNQNLK